MKGEFTKGGGAKPRIDKPKKIIPAFTVIRVEGGWAFVEMTVDESFQTLSVEVSNPDMKPIITEKFRVAVGKYWQGIDEQTI